MRLSAIKLRPGEILARDPVRSLINTSAKVIKTSSESRLPSLQRAAGLNDHYAIVWIPLATKNYSLATSVMATFHELQTSIPRAILSRSPEHPTTVPEAAVTALKIHSPSVFIFPDRTKPTTAARKTRPQQLPVRVSSSISNPQVRQSMKRSFGVVKNSFPIRRPRKVVVK